MQFTAAAIALAFMATQVLANSVEFVNQDSIQRTIYFTPQEGKSSMDSVTVEGLGSQNVTFPDQWIGNFYAIEEGAENTPGMLGEVSFDGWDSTAVWFDVSAIVDPNDNSNVKQLYPASSKTPVSGCQSFPCDNAYNKWDDVETQSSSEAELICLLGNLSSSKSKRGGAVLPTRAADNTASAKVGREVFNSKKQE